MKKRHLKHEHYIDCLTNMSTFTVSQNIIKSRKQIVSSYNVKKTALTAFDTKRWIACDGIHTLAHGHYRVDDINCSNDCIHIV